MRATAGDRISGVFAKQDARTGIALTRRSRWLGLTAFTAFLVAGALIRMPFDAALAIPGGVGATWCWARFHGPAWSGREILVIGSAAGLGSGLLLAFAVDCLARMAHRRFFAPTPEP